MWKFLKYLVYFACLALWLAFIVSAMLELWARWQYQATATKNPFVLSRLKGEPWPIPDSESNTFSDWLLDKELRTQYRGRDKSETPLPPISAEWERENRMALYNDLDASDRQVFNNLYKTDEDTVEVTSGIVDVTDDINLWREQFFLYRKHVRKKDHVNVLGLTENFYSNNHGFRDMDFPVEKAPDVFRIVCLGASTTEEGPTNDLTYPSILEAMLNRHFDTNRFEVINCGISGMNSLKHRIRSADYLALNPDLIIIYNAVNDICHDLFPLWITEVPPWQQRLRKSTFINHYFNKWLLPGPEKMDVFIKQNKIADLRFIAERAAKQHVPVALCSFAAPGDVPLSADEYEYYNYCTYMEWGGRYVMFDSYLRALDTYNKAIRALCEEASLMYIPVAENMRGGAALFGDICHLRNPGIEKKAKFIADFLIKKNLVK